MAYDEVKEAIETLMSGFEEFKAANDRRLDYVETVLNRPTGGGGSGFGKGNGTNPETKSAWDGYFRRGPQAMEAKAQALLSTNVDPAGGYLLTAEVNKSIIERIHALSPVRQLAQVFTISTDQLEGFGAVEDDDAGWVAETATRTGTNMTDFSKWAITVAEMYAYPSLTQKLLDDASIDVGAFVESRIARKFSRLEGVAFTTGDGIGKPTGILSYPVSSSDDDVRSWGALRYIASGSASAITADSLYSMVFSLKPEYSMNATWLMSRTTMNSIAQLKDGQGGYLLRTDGLAQGVPMQLLGYPIKLDDTLPAIGANTYPVVFGDFRAGYAVVDHAIGTAILRDPYTTKGRVGFYSRRRCGGGVLDFDALRVMKVATS